MSTTFELTIRPRKGWQAIDFREIYLYRELLAFLVWRDIKIRYRQTLLGGLWAILQPFITMLVFTFIFNRMAGVKSDGPPYPLFAYAGLAPWTFFSTSVTQSSNSLITNQQLVSKVYFPRIFIPLGAIGALLLDLVLSLSLFGGMMVYYHWRLTWSVLWLPVFLTPVIYPARYLSQRGQMLMGLNPMAGVVIGFRHALLGSPASWGVMGLSLVISVSLFISGLLIFRRMED